MAKATREEKSIPYPDSHAPIRQLAAWAAQIESSPVQGKRHLTSQERKLRQARSAANSLHHQFLISLTPDHTLYDTKEAREAREREGEGDRR